MKKSVFLTNGLLLSGILFLMVSCLPDRSGSRFPDYLPVYTHEKLQEAFPDSEFIVGFGLNDTDLRLSIFDAVADILIRMMVLQNSYQYDDTRKDLSRLLRPADKKRLGNSLIAQAVTDEFTVGDNAKYEMFLKLEGINPDNRYVLMYHYHREKRYEDESIKITVKDDMMEEALFSLSFTDNAIERNVNEDEFNKVIEKVSKQLNAIEGVVCGVLKETGAIFISCNIEAIKKWN